MFTYRDIIDAHQIWEQKFQNAGRERINLSVGKPRSLISILRYIIRKIVKKSADSRGSIKPVLRKSNATS